MSRTLYVIPIVHAEADLGRIAGTLRALSSDEAWAEKQRAVGDMWNRIAAWCRAVDPERWFIFQDGLPDDPVAERIVEDLAVQGSPNHRVIRDLLRRGAVLVGTEPPDLLLREYEYACSAARAAETGTPVHQGADRNAITLLELRDRAIAARIDASLSKGDRGVLFVGMLHDVTSKLPADIDVLLPLGTNGMTGETGVAG